MVDEKLACQPQPIKWNRRIIPFIPCIIRCVHYRYQPHSRSSHSNHSNMVPGQTAHHISIASRPLNECAITFVCVRGMYDVKRALCMHRTTTIHGVHKIFFLSAFDKSRSQLIIIMQFWMSCLCVCAEEWCVKHIYFKRRICSRSIALPPLRSPSGSTAFFARNSLLSLYLSLSLKQTFFAALVRTKCRRRSSLQWQQSAENNSNKRIGETATEATTTTTETAAATECVSIHMNLGIGSLKPRDLINTFRVRIQRAQKAASENGHFSYLLPRFSILHHI